MSWGDLHDACLTAAGAEDLLFGGAIIEAANVIVGAAATGYSRTVNEAAIALAENLSSGTSFTAGGAMSWLMANHDQVVAP